jgi:Na+-translocating ferredoxin:NAD+ oxidoreductase RnfC subunit
MNLIEKVMAAGVVGAGGAGFPTHVKLNTKAECLIINAAECEPLIETDKYLCRTYPKRIVNTIVQMVAHLEAQRGVIALKEKYTREIAALEAAIAAAGAQDTVEIFPMRSFYPAGDEQVMVQQITGKSIPERGLPLDVGCVVENVGTVCGIADALEDKPVTHKFLSVTGAVVQPTMFLVPLGTPIREVIAAAQLTTKEYSVISGGPMMGKMLPEDTDIDSTYVTKTTGNLLVLPRDHYLVRRSSLTIERMARQAATACIQCRMCTDLCPRHLIGHEIRPNLIMRALFREPSMDEEQYLKSFGSAINCCSCGACEMFSCPMGLSPRKINDFIKGRLKEKGMQPERNLSPTAQPGIDHHKIPTERLIARLGLAEYYTHELPTFQELHPTTCFLPMSQHIGAPAQPIVELGSKVAKQTLVATAGKGLSANIYTGIGGTVTEVSERGIRISSKEA